MTLNLNEKEIVKLYSKGKSLKECSVIYRCSPETIRKVVLKFGKTRTIHETNLGRKCTEEAKKKTRLTWKKKEPNLSENDVIKLYLDGHSLKECSHVFRCSSWYIKKIILALGKMRHFGESNFGKTHTEETKLKLSKAQKGKTGEKSSNWKGGISFQPYCIKFTKEFKERVREFFDRKCYVCGKNENELGRKLDVHHVNYDKMVCCNDTEPLFVPLCQQCHLKTNQERESWQEFFTISLEYLTSGKCYYSKEEMQENGL